MFICLVRVHLGHQFFQHTMLMFASLLQVFSSTPLAKDLLKEMFDNPVVLESKSWLAYPVFNSPEEFAPYVLDSGFFYNNTVENSASAMEMSAIAAKNVVNCLIKYMVEKDHLQE